MNQSTSDSMNSESYWDNRFVTDWESNGGKEQSRFFSRIALKAFPSWFVKIVNDDAMSVCDWGCAQGDGTEVLAKLWNPAITGIDFSVSAIKKANENYPDVNFLCKDFIAEEADGNKFDVLFSSNTLEHFSEPWQVVSRISRHAQKLMAFLVPFREIERIDEHFYTFNFDNIPFSFDGWTLVHAKVINASVENPNYWKGEQILIIYIAASELARGDISLADIVIDNQLLSPNSSAQTLAATEHRSASAGSNEAGSNDLATGLSPLGVEQLIGAAEALKTIKEEFLQRLDKQANLNLELQKHVQRLDKQANLSLELQKHDEILKQYLTAMECQQGLKAEQNALVDEMTSLEAEHANKITALKAQLQAAELRTQAAEQQIGDALNLIQTIRASTSWRITKPARLLARVIRYGIVESDRDNVKARLRKIYHRLPISLETKTKLRSNYKAITEPVQEIRRASLMNLEFTFPSVSLMEQQEGVPDYLVWGVIDWHFRHQRPQQLAQALAKSGRRVFYISVNFKDDPRAGFDIESLDGSGRLFQVNLYVKGAPVIYSAAPGIETITQLRKSTGLLLGWAKSQEVVSFVQHPFWYDIALALPNSHSVYDCMDHHEGFGNTANDILSLEHALMRNADLTITTSDWLDNIVSDHTKRRVLIRNASDYDYFSKRPNALFQDSRNRKIIGYYGAIAEWFDQDLVEKIAKQFPEVCILLVGADTVNAKSRLGNLPNIEFVGEVPYSKLPYYLYAFDVCLLPFKVIPLTLATNPVKVYEYLSAGKAVVSVDLPELKQFGELVFVSSDSDSFVKNIRDALATPASPDILESRKSFAKGQTWNHRAKVLIDSVELRHTDPSVSVIVVTYNNLDYTKACLESLDNYSLYSPVEIIVVDNASSDGSPEFLDAWQKQAPNRKLILNQENRGFAAANNQGLLIASGDYLVLLNNDTWVTPGWIRTMIGHFRRDKSIGLLGPVTNNIGNEAKIQIDYRDISEMLIKSSEYTLGHIGESFRLSTAAFFCVMMPRHVYEKIGPLDEIFGRGFFEDDDYCRRVEQIGLNIVCAQDVFIHHHLSASFNKLKSPERQALFERNKAAYEKKWGKWVPHAYKDKSN